MEREPPRTEEIFDRIERELRAEQPDAVTIPVTDSTAYQQGRRAELFGH